MNKKLQERIEKEGQALMIGGNVPLVLSGRGKAWWIQSGKAEVFACAQNAGQATGRRIHKFTAGPGSLLLGIDLPEAGGSAGLVAVGLGECRMVQISMDLLKKWAGESEELAGAVARLVDGWVLVFSSGLEKEVKPLTSYLLETGWPRLLSGGETARAKNGTLWIRVEKGDVLFLDMENVPTAPGSLFPLSEFNWVQAAVDAEIRTFESSVAVRQKGFWDGLELFNRYAATYSDMRRKLDEVDEHNRLAAKAENENEARLDSYTNLASVLKGKKSNGRKTTQEDPLVAACQSVGEAMGIRIVSPLKLPGDRQTTYTVEDVARASRVRTRKVDLKGDWWRKDCGPILGFARDTQTPVALVPVSPQAYDMIVPAEGRRVWIGPAEAAGLDASGYVFYRSFPDILLTGRDVLRLGFWGCRKDLLMVLGLGAAGALLALLTPLAMGILFDRVIPEASKNMLVQVILVLLSCAIVTSVFDFTKSIAILRLKGKIDPAVEAGVVDRLISLPVNFFRKFSTGDLANRAMSICAISQTLSDVTLQAVLAGAFSSFYFLLLFWYSWPLALLAVLLTLIGTTCTTLSSIVQMRYSRKLNDIEGRVAGTLLQLVSGITKLRVSGTEERAFDVWAREFAEKKRVNYKARLLDNVMESFNAAFPILASMVIFAWVVLKSTREFSTGSFIAFNTAYTSFQGALLQMSLALTSVLNVVPLFERARPILETRPEVDLTKADPGLLSGEIEISHVNFRYEIDGPVILHDVSMHVKAGEFLAVVGTSGSGNSTLLRLLLGFDVPESGTIYYDRQDLATLDIQKVRRQLGVVLQNGHVMPGTLLKNIIGTSRLTVADAWEAARMVGFDEDIRNMPLGMYTVLGADGSTLSGGQRQRLLLARSIVHRPRILFFDEATSALDNRTQAIVSESLDGIQATRIVIAHRLSTIINADHIVVIEKGRIVESGTYKELLEKGGVFSELAKRQMA